MGGIVGAVASVAAPVIGGLFGGSSAPSGPTPYQPTGSPTADQQIQSLMTQNYNNLFGPANPYTTYNPQITDTFNRLYNTPGAAGYTSAANAAGTGYTGVGNQSLGVSNQIASAIPQLLTGGNTVYNMGVDPQSALYNQLLQQTVDQANVRNAQYGLTGQQAAGDVNQATTNFNLDWQNQQLARALQGLTGAGQALTTAGTSGTAAQNVGAAGAGSLLSGGAAPYNVGQTIGGNQNTALAQLMQFLQGPQTSSQQTIADLLSYLGYGTSAAQAGNNAALNDYYAQLTGGAMGSQAGAGIGSALGSLFNTQASPTSLFGNLAPSGAGGIADIASTLF